MGANQKDFFALEAGSELPKEVIETDSGRIEQDFSGHGWKMEKMRVGEGVAQGLHLLKSELSGNNFSWNSAMVPGDVYTDLHLAGEIDDPYYGRNMHKAKWVMEYEWWYNYAFNVDEIMNGKKITLFFEGVDYSCEVWLNQKYLGKHEGMYSSFEFDVTDIIDYSQPHVPVNLLSIKLDPPPRNQQNVAGLKHNFQGDYYTGLIPFGIWRPVKLIATNKVKIDNYRLDYKLGENLAKASFEVDVRNFGGELKDVACKVILKDGEISHVADATITLGEGESNHKIAFDIENPRLWWPYDLGESFLYDLEIILTEGDLVLDKINDKTGIREVTMEMNPGFTPEEAENPWTFVVNGKPMFLRSACWGGQPSFLYGRNSVEKYEFYLSKVREANINNLRIFGWHPPEVTEFYEICDRLGITVWTNFTFATQEFRSDREYVEKVRKEIEATIKARRNHPSMVMWMGGEEVYFTEAHVHSKNRELMEEIGEVTKQFTNVPYADASPLSSREAMRMGYASKESAHANSHYYAAGAIFMEDYYPFLDYAIIPELTAASAPDVESLKKFMPEEDLWPIGPCWGYHQANVDVLKNLNYEVFGDRRLDSLESFVEGTQIAQGTVAQFALEHFRRQKPHVSGVALCHFITNWPIIKWDIVDYYGVEKRSFAYVKRSFNPILPSLEFKKRRWMPGETFAGNLYVINDYYETFSDVTYKYEILDTNKKVLHQGELMVEIGENVAEKVGEISFEMQEGMDKDFYVNLKLVKDNEVLSENEYCLLVADQEEALAKALEMYNEMHVARRKYGKAYYRFTPEMLEGL